MRSELRYSTEQAYIGSTTEFVELYDGAFLQMFGRGEGTVTWGVLRDGSNGPTSLRDAPTVCICRISQASSGWVHPIARSCTGCAVSLPPDERDRRLFAGPVRWFTVHPDYLWLNDRWGFEEGELDRDALDFTSRAFVLHPEAPE